MENLGRVGIQISNNSPPHGHSGAQKGGRSVKSQKCQTPNLDVVLMTSAHISRLEFSLMTIYKEKRECSLHVRRKGKMDFSR